MAAYAYSAINAQGVLSDGEIHAPSVGVAREQLRIRGLLAESLVELSSVGEDGVKNTFKKIKPKSLQIFSRQFATMIEAGLSVVAALVILGEQTDDKYLAQVIGELRADVEGGLLLSQAMDRHPKIFTRLFVSMVESGEAAGILDQVLDRMAFQIERETKLKSRVKGAMMYPTMVLNFATLVLTGMLLFLVPFFSKVFLTLGGTLPTLTQYVVNMSNFIKSDWYLIIAFAVGGTFGFKRWRRTNHGKRNWDRFKLRLPMKIGDVVLKITMARFSRTFSTLVAAGVDIIKAIEITSQTAGNWVVEEALIEAKQKVHDGVPISQPLVENPVFPPMVSQMIKVGEETGELD
ncbi:MAG: type pilus assembly protein PilC, partial [Thermoleophilaceae bacterium]|nr:type pilus assembly protein PilC [Thermoleophilaceae bacterium]